MATARKQSQNVEIEIKDKGKLLLKLTAEDEHTIYLNGTWKLMSAKPESLAQEVLGNRRSGDFRRNKASRLLEMRDAIVTLQPVDSDHGLAYGGRGVAATRVKGSHPWMAY